MYKELNRTRIKFCGVTHLRDVQYAARLGADAAGMVFVSRSVRALTLARAAELRKQWPPLLHAVALFVDPERDLVEAAIDASYPTILQFHGDESAEFCTSFNRPYIKAVKAETVMRSGNHIQAYKDSAMALLIDAGIGDKGGGGEPFDWGAWQEQSSAMPLPWLLAGGLTPDNVGMAMNKLHPYGVDVSSGVERTRGVKDPALMRRFTEAVRRADEHKQERQEAI